ncbi:MAG TPA: Fe(2+)-trafficking protein [Chloroflexota bacterium]|jgi:Fe-S cluster biosynthesis and repair protein YggX
MATITCARCGQRSEALPGPPLAGAAGVAVQTHTCPACWAEWQQAAPSYINHYGLQMVQPAGRARLYELMREFLSIPTAE